MRIFWLVLVFAGCLTLSARAQKPDTTRYRSKADSLARKRDSAESVPFLERATRVRKNKKVEVPDSLHSPQKAVRRALILPGWGQLYNRHYIKFPIVVVGLAATGYFIVWNNSNYREYLALAKFQQTGLNWDNPIYANDKNRDLYRTSQERQYSTQAVIDQKDYWRRNRDLCILGFVLGWGIQAVDAYVWAKFKHSYSMDNDLASRRIQFSGGPVPVYAANNVTFVPTLKITIPL